MDSVQRSVQLSSADSVGFPALCILTGTVDPPLAQARTVNSVGLLVDRASRVRGTLWEGMRYNHRMAEWLGQGT